MDSLTEVRALLGEVLNLNERTGMLERATPLFGAIPELDSMAVVTVVTALEDRFEIEVDDDEISAAIFETVGSLSDFVDQKRVS